MRRKLYNFIIHQGLKILSIAFPDIHMSVPLKPDGRFLEYPFAFGHLPPNKDAKVLDIGCAGNFFPLVVAALGYDVTACDIRPYEIPDGLKFKNFVFIQQDICKNPLPKETFDVVTCISVLEHIGLKGRYGAEDERDGDLEMVKQIYRVLKPGGTTIITIPYGRAEIIAPYHRIYDYSRIQAIKSAFKIIKEEFYTFDSEGN